MDLDASVGLRVTGEQLPTAHAELTQLLRDDPRPEVHLALGLMDFLVGRFAESQRNLETSFLEFRKQNRPHRAALAASHLGRLASSGLGNELVAAGWNSRAWRLLGDDDCVERGWVALGNLGCNVPSAEELARASTLALDVARRFEDCELECRALGESGLALVSRGGYDEGMHLLEEALTMTLSGECVNAFINGQVQCSFISACERGADLPRLEAWLQATASTGAAVGLVKSHCQKALGSLYCLAGRWSEADAELTAGVRDTRELHVDIRANSSASLAELRIQQGRLTEAESLLRDWSAAEAAQLPLAMLHLAMGRHDLAVATCTAGLQLYEGDLVRCARLRSMLVEAELGRGDVLAAGRHAEELRALAARSPAALPVRARAELATAQVAIAEDRVEEACAHATRALQLLRGGWPLLAGRCHLLAAEALAGSSPAAALAHAREALKIFGPIGASHRFVAQELLQRLDTDRTTAARQQRVLTAREQEVLSLLGEGLSNPEIARRLVISPKTAEHHVGAILRKLDLRSRTEAAARATSLLQLEGYRPTSK